MKSYLLTGEAFRGQVAVEYNDAGILSGCCFENAALSENQQVWLLRNIPVSTGGLPDFLKAAPSLRMQEMEYTEPTFDRFWDAYDDKINSSKRKTKLKWDKMPSMERIKAYRYIGTYFRNLPTGTRKKYAETYLNAELWNN